LIQLRTLGLYDCPMAETIRQRVGIDRCEGSLQTLFALTLMDLAEFEWRRPDGHGWEVGRWPGLRLTLLAQPESGPHQAPFAICPLPQNDNEVPFILLISLRQAIPSSFSDTQCTSVSIFTLTPVEIQRDPRSCAHRVFDRAVQLQLRHVEARYARYRQALPGLPCMKATLEIAERFTAPMSAMETRMAGQNRIKMGSPRLG
jgi:hypothetical protein